MRRGRAGGGVWRRTHSQFCTGMHKNACYKACPRFYQSMKTWISNMPNHIWKMLGVSLYNQTCQGISEIVREGSNAQTVNTLTLTLTPEALARSLFSSPLLLLVAWLLLSPFDHRSWCCEFQGRKKWQMPTEISWKVFFTNNSTSDSLKRQAKLSSSWGIITFFVWNLEDLTTQRIVTASIKLDINWEVRDGRNFLSFLTAFTPLQLFFCRLVNEKKTLKMVAFLCHTVLTCYADKGLKCWNLHCTINM